MFLDSRREDKRLALNGSKHYLNCISVTISLNYTQYSASAYFHGFHFTVAHALGFSLSNSRCLVGDLNTRTVTSKQYDVFLSFLLRSPSTADPILQSLHCTVLISALQSLRPCFVTPSSPQSISTSLHYPFPGKGFITLSLWINLPITYSVFTGWHQLQTSRGYFLPPTELASEFTSLISILYKSHGKHRLYCWWPHRIEKIASAIVAWRHCI
jgi:hypothetical protein